MATSSNKTRQPASDVQITDAALAQRSQELGILGKLFGARDHAPINIAGGLILLGVAGMILVVLITPTNPLMPDVVKALAALVLASLTFLGGYLGGTKDH
jgi:peptidoglycan/LPS O-acetylase OafA/YrhL